jgi:hypothetical protein
MKTLRAFVRMFVLLIIVASATVAVAACSLATTNTGGSTGGATPTVAATATAKPKPTGVPAITVPYCQSVMTVAEANQIMSPPTPATTIVANSAATGGSCHYHASPTTITLNIFFETWTGPAPIPQQDITAAIAQLAGLPGVTVTTFTTVNGVGDQAAFIVATATRQGVTINANVFYVLDGGVLFGCYTFSGAGIASAPGTQSQLQQCAQLVVSRL